MGYSGVYVFGDSLVDSGNALGLAEWYGDLTFSDLPEGAPVASQGYFDGRFSDGYTFADLLSNKIAGAVTRPVFPFDYEDPWVGIRIDPFEPEPRGNNLNFAYGGAQIRQGDEVVPDLDGQVDAFQDAVDARADPNALYFVTIGGNDVRSLAPATADPTPAAEAYAHLDDCAAELVQEIGQLIGIGARNIMISGIPDVGLIPNYDRDAPGTPGYGTIEGEEVGRSAAATDYSLYLDNLIRNFVVPEVQKALVARGVSAADAAKMVTYVPVMGADYVSATGNVVTPALEAVLPTLESLHGLAAGELTTNLLEHQGLVFFDQIHPTAQVHALVGSYMYSTLTGTAWIETLPLAGGKLNYVTNGMLSAVGEVDRISVSLVQGTTYTIEMLGMASLGIAGSVADGSLRIVGPNGAAITQFAPGSGNDSGAGFDANFTFTAAATGKYVIELSAVGNITGSYQLQAGVVGGTAMLQGNNYSITTVPLGIIEGVGGIGTDAVYTSISYALAAGSEIELLTTNSQRGKESINLTGNAFDQIIRGNYGANVIEGKGGADTLTGYSGKDVFVLGPDALSDAGAIDRITDYERGDIVDLKQVLSVGAGVNVASGGYVRVTSTGLIQVDTDGHGDDWVTLATVGGGGAVTVRYLSGGATASVNLSRVAETYGSSAMEIGKHEPAQQGGILFDGAIGDARDGAAHAFAAQWAGDGLWASAMHGLAQAGEPLHLDLLSMRGDGALFV